jgi:hypothetical protein
VWAEHSPHRTEVIRPPLSSPYLWISVAWFGLEIWGGLRHECGISDEWAAVWARAAVFSLPGGGDEVLTVDSPSDRLD